ncbi:DUF7548 family protein [Natrononativus amylolyticus]|uniref:DUF7548 family protein n=1 Tax=Natrononativus amylolyticus TaxID=2963434 RepID=UPI0020CCF4D8|nr:hypothetical protein [Natrononativus amylolyticus]
MRPEQRPPTAGIVASISYLVVVFVPYVLLSETEAAALPTYYDFGLAGPQFLAVLPLVGLVLFAAGRQQRTEPDYVAGLTLVLGMVLTALIAIWAISVPENVVLSIGEASWLEYHRWLVLLAGLAMVACSLWYAKSLELL